MQPAPIDGEIDRIRIGGKNQTTTITLKIPNVFASGDDYKKTIEMAYITNAPKLRVQTAPGY